MRLRGEPKPLIAAGRTKLRGKSRTDVRPKKTFRSERFDGVFGPI
jgi:hypothetical protein